MRRILANLLWEDDLALRRTTQPRTVLETVSGLATLLRVFAREGDHLWTPSPVDPARVLEVPGVSRPVLESGPLEALPPAEETLAWGGVSLQWGIGANFAASSPAQDPHPCPSPDHPIPLPGRGVPSWGVLAVLPLLPVRGWRGSGEEGRGDEGLGRRNSQAAKLAPMLHRGEALHDLLWTLPSPSPTIAASVHHRAFCLQIAEELGIALPGSQVVDSLAGLDKVLSSSQAPRAWVLKAPLSASGRNRYIERMGPRISDPKTRRTIERLFKHHGPLLFEPWMNRTADFGVSALLDPSGLRIVGVHGQRVDMKGQFAGIDLQPLLSKAERARLQETADFVGAALRRQGYVGPFGVDAWRYRNENSEETLHPLGEINARMTFGLVAWALAERVAGVVRLCFGRNLPATAEDKNTAVVPLLAPGASKSPAAWVERTGPP